MRVATIDMKDTNQQCPEGFEVNLVQEEYVGAGLRARRVPQSYSRRTVCNTAGCAGE